jgi:hypothetical protein
MAVWQTLTHVLGHMYTHICTYSDMYVCLPVCMYACMYDVGINVGMHFQTHVVYAWKGTVLQCTHTYHCVRVKMHIKIVCNEVCHCTWKYAVPFDQVSCYHNKQHVHRVMYIVPAVHNQQQV